MRGTFCRRARTLLAAIGVKPTKTMCHYRKPTVVILKCASEERKVLNPTLNKIKYLDVFYSQFHDQEEWFIALVFLFSEMGLALVLSLT